MARIASFGSPLVDPDLDELRDLASAHDLSLRIDTAARARGRPAIELYAKDRPGKPLLTTFRHAAQGLEWLQAGRPEEAGQ